ncbi:hypothetical protein CH249_14610 [Rhodococcus sp. 05-2255-3B1]|uniref:hyaluronate lyase N-terminal domain-containing protein n=1 Tax=unclassified Rhodococcus (in: high G+C Gram-positive bacteria) TaxID=192944 RepID=UPI000B9A5CD7|nr:MULTISPECIES: hypothetical protein [unclassified Rhodococcus (in: high G+C Gram-positive bacteria)]OZE03045.1 hypothetical protein CH250_22675 [Rhodococcus sp. 05-2255-3C]OZE09435.1 hypothetical protein CH249_14610 [Rhodococcus sp. 05-2255-3B1]
MGVIQVRRGTTAVWAAADPVLAPGEPGYDTEREVFKVGNGSDRWSSLAASPTTAALGETYLPYDGVFPAALVAVDQYLPDNAPAGYAAITGTRWDSTNFNMQGQLIEAVNPAVPAAGCVNKPTSRNVGAMIDFEFDFDGDKLAPHLQAFGYVDTQIYIEHDGKMKRLRADPLGTSHEGYVFRDVKFTRRIHGRVRIVMPFLYFVQILHEGNAVIRRSPDRVLAITDGDSYFDMSSAYVAGSAKSFMTHGPSEALLERTGWAIGRHGQGGTGQFNNGTGADSAAPAPGGSTRFFSPDRLAGIKRHGIGNIDLYIVNGTINDGELSGGRAAMKARALANYRALHDWDPGILIVVVGPEPINNPPANGLHDLNRQGLIDAVIDHSAEGGLIVYLDPGKPGAQWWAGTGTEAAPNVYDAQSKLVGMDGIHGNWYLYELYGHWIALLLSQVRVPALRKEPTNV